MQCRGIKPHLAARGNSHGFSQVAAGTCGIFSSYGRDDPSTLMLFPQSQDFFLVTRDTLGISSRLDRAIRTLLEVSRDSPSSCEMRAEPAFKLFQGKPAFF